MRASSAAGSSRSAGRSRPRRPAGAVTAKKSRSMSSVRSFVSSCFECLSQDRLAPCKLALDRVHRDAADGGELAIAQAVDVVQRQEHPRFARDARQCPREVDTAAYRGWGGRGGPPHSPPGRAGSRHRSPLPPAPARAPPPLRGVRGGLVPARLPPPPLVAADGC